MILSKTTVRTLIVSYLLIITLFFCLSIFQEVIVTKRLNWSIILVDFFMDATFLTIAFLFFYFLLRKVQAANNAALAQKERYQQVLDNMKEGIQMLDADYKYLYLNDAAIRQSKLAREKLLGYSIVEKYPGVELSDLFGYMQTCLRDQVVFDIENDFTYPDGSKSYFELFIEPVPSGLFILSLDITERRQRELEQKRRIDEIHEILFKISHEVRQPVVQLQGITNVLADNQISAAELITICDMMSASVALLDRRTRELSEYVASLNTI